MISMLRRRRDANASRYAAASFVYRRHPRFGNDDFFDSTLAMTSRAQSTFDAFSRRRRRHGCAMMPAEARREGARDGHTAAAMRKRRRAAVRAPRQEMLFSAHTYAARSASGALMLMHAARMPFCMSAAVGPSPQQAIHSPSFSSARRCRHFQRGFVILR